MKPAPPAPLFDSPDTRGEAQASGTASGGASPSGDAPCSKADDTRAIGTAEMAVDGTLTLSLRAESVDANGCVTAMGDAQFVYKPDHKDYDMVRKHVGPIAPGETKSVKPWPPTP